MSKHTPDFGEPWTYGAHDGSVTVDRVGQGCTTRPRQSRAVACVNAMAGIPDPAAFVEAARRVAEWSNPPSQEGDMPGLRLAIADLAATLETKP